MRGQWKSKLSGGPPEKTCTWEVLQQPEQCGLHFKQDLRPEGRDQRHIADELQGVSEALFGVEEDAATAEVLSLPLRLGERSALADEGAGSPALLVLRPALDEVTVAQEMDAQVEAGERGVGLPVQDEAVTGEGARFVAKVAQRQAKVGEGGNVSGIAREHRAQALNRAEGIALRLQDRRKVAVGVEEVGLEFDGAEEEELGGAEFAGVKQERSQVGEGFCEVGIEADRVCVAFARGCGVSKLMQRQGKRVVGLGVSRIALKGFPITGHGFGEAVSFE
jgi:hypothetical protein